MINKCVPIYISVVRSFKVNVILNIVSSIKKKLLLNILSVVFVVIDKPVYSITTIQFTFHSAYVIVFVIVDKWTVGQILWENSHSLFGY